MKFKLEIDKDACIGCGSCTSVCDNWELVDGKAQPKKSIVDDIGCNKDAEGICPVSAIKIIEMK